MALLTGGESQEEALLTLSFQTPDEKERQLAIGTHLQTAHLVARLAQVSSVADAKILDIETEETDS